MKIEGEQIIGLTQDKSNTGTGFYAVNPNTGKEMTEVKFYDASEDQMNKAIELASNAHQIYKNYAPEKRAAFLKAIAEEIEKIGDLLTKTACQETGLPIGRLNGERGRTTGQLRLFAEWIEEGSYLEATIDEAAPDRQPMPRADIRRMNQPLGPVVIFGASNFPLAFSVAGGDTASALAAGCPVVAKAHPAHPGTSELVGKAIRLAAQKCDMPEGVFSLLQGKTHQTGEFLVTHPSIKAVGFTGSFRGGKALYKLANSRRIPIPVFAEMGSTNPVFILPGAVKSRGKAIAAGLAGSINLGAGQFCTNPGVLITQQTNETSSFNTEISSAIEGQPSQVMLSPGIHNSYVSRSIRLTQLGKYEIWAQGQIEENLLAGRPTLFHANYSDVKDESHLTKEIFGPSSIMISANDEDEILNFAESLDGHLTATIHADDSDSELVGRLLPILQEKVGRIIFNGYPTGVEVCHAMVHGGPYPATTDSSTTSVGTAAIFRFLRPVCYQDIPDQHLPHALKRNNPLRIMRLVNGNYEH